MYSLTISLVLLGMIITGAGRSVAVKLFYQLGFENPVLVTFLYHLGQSLSLVVYFVSRQMEQICKKHYDKCSYERESELVGCSSNVKSDVDDCDFVVDKNPSSREGGDLQSKEEEKEKIINVNKCSNGDSGTKTDVTPTLTTTIMSSSLSLSSSSPTSVISSSSNDSKMRRNSLQMNHFNTATSKPPSLSSSNKPLYSGSTHGLSPHTESNNNTHNLNAPFATSLLPWYLLPLIPGFFNLTNAILRWASLLYTTASIAEMLISGLELIWSVMAGYIVRGRVVSMYRWCGVGIVFVGVLVVGVADLFRPSNEDATSDVDGVTNFSNFTTLAIGSDDGDDDGISSGSSSSSRRDSMIGMLLITGQCLMSVMQDVAEEVFIQTSDFPPTLLLGMEGVFGLVLGALIYVPIYGLDFNPGIDSSSLGDIGNGDGGGYNDDERKDAEDGVEFGFDISVKVKYCIGLTLLFTLTGIFNIMATGVTSSITRNVWKNFRTMMVWIIGLILYYSNSNSNQDGLGKNIGEKWVIPTSYIIMFGFGIMLGGIYVYYIESSGSTTHDCSEKYGNGSHTETQEYQNQHESSICNDFIMKRWDQINAFFAHGTKGFYEKMSSFDRDESPGFVVNGTTMVTVDPECYT